MSDDDDSSYGDNEADDMYIIDEISQYDYYQTPIDEHGYPIEDRMDGKYYIGFYSCGMDCYVDTDEVYAIKVLEKTPKLFFGACIQVNTFFHFDFADIVRFLEYCKNKYTIDRLPFEPKLKVHIMQLHIEPVMIPQGFLVDQYLCVLKTHWISLVQRHWKSVLLARKKYVEYYGNPKHQRSRELGDRNVPKMSGLRGMLSCYSSKK